MAWASAMIAVKTGQLVRKALFRNLLTSFHRPLTTSGVPGIKDVDSDLDADTAREFQPERLSEAAIEAVEPPRILITGKLKGSTMVDLHPKCPQITNFARQKQ